LRLRDGGKLKQSFFIFSHISDSVFILFLVNGFPLVKHVKEFEG